MNTYYKRIEKYMSKHPMFNSLVHVVGGMGLGFLLTYPVAGEHPVRWAVVFLVLSLLGHYWAVTH